jgi:hypothetical protein
MRHNLEQTNMKWMQLYVLKDEGQQTLMKHAQLLVTVDSGYTYTCTSWTKIP